MKKDYLNRVFSAEEEAKFERIFNEEKAILVKNNTISEAESQSIEYHDKTYQAFRKEIARIESERMAVEICDKLQIPVVYDGLVKATTLIEILMDEDKLKDLLSRIRNKAFW